MGHAATPIRERVESEIAAYLGRSTAASAVRIAARTWLQLEPEALVQEHLARLCDGLRPMLKTLLGADVAGAIVDKIGVEVDR